MEKFMQEHFRAIHPPGTTARRLPKSAHRSSSCYFAISRFSRSKHSAESISHARRVEHNSRTREIVQFPLLAQNERNRRLFPL